MREYFDKNTGLTWVVPEVVGVLYDAPKFLDGDAKAIAEFTKELNSHEVTPNINKFVTGDGVGIGDFMVWVLGKNDLPFYAFDDGKLVGISIINGVTKIRNTDGLKEYIDFCKSSDEYKNGLEGYISLKKAKRFLDKSTTINNVDLGYITVVPTAQGRGVGTRMISSILHNPQFFASNPTAKTIDSIVHHQNIASQKAFERNGFDMYSVTKNFHNYIHEL